MSKINNYEELVAERRKAEARIAEQKIIMREGIAEVREKLKPFLYLLPLLNVFKKEEKGSSLLKGAVSLGIDLLFGQNLLVKSNWFTRLMVPVLLKGFSSKVIGANGKSVVR